MYLFSFQQAMMSVAPHFLQVTRAVELSPPPPRTMISGSSQSCPYFPLLSHRFPQSTQTCSFNHDGFSLAGTAAMLAGFLHIPHLFNTCPVANMAFFRNVVSGTPSTIAGPIAEGAWFRKGKMPCAIALPACRFYYLLTHHNYPSNHFSRPHERPCSVA